MKFKSEYFEDAQDLVQAKDDAASAVRTKRERLNVIRRFVNMMPTLSEEEKQLLNRTEATNFGILYSNLVVNEAMFTMMTTGTNELLEIIVDTDNPEQDTVTGVRLSEAINVGAIQREGLFSDVWKQVGGETVIAGGVPTIQSPDFGWCPEIAIDMIFPRDTPTQSSQIPYAFNPADLSMRDLKDFEQMAKDKKKSNYDVSSIKILIETLKENIKDQGTSSSRETEFERTKAIRDRDLLEKETTIPAWWYYEVKYEKNGESYVSATLFTDNVELKANINRTQPKKESSFIICHIEKAYAFASDWLRMVAIDSEIGGVKKIDSMRGIAEMTYAASLEVEELMNLLLEGDKMRAKPKFRLLEGKYNRDAVEKWNSMLDVYVPEGVEEMEIRSSAQHLLTPLGMLQQAASKNSAAPYSNQGRGGELLRQQEERVQSNSAITASRINAAYQRMDSILETVVWRLLAGPAKPGTTGYQETMWVRARLDRYGIDYKKLASRKHGRFEFLRVRARRVTGNGNREDQLAISDWLMKNAINYPPSVRPIIIHKATVLQTGDPDLADMLIPRNVPVINRQKITAENEADTIRRRVALGHTLPINPEDIHQDHIPVHILDMQALLARNELAPWGKIDVLEFSGLAEHTADHLQVLLSNPETNPEGKLYMPAFQQVIAEAQPAIDVIEEAEAQQGQALTPAEQANLELKLMAEQRKWMEMGLKVEDMQRIWQQRAQREQTTASANRLAHRSQYAKEINEAERLELDKKTRVAQIAASKQKSKQSA